MVVDRQLLEKSQAILQSRSGEFIEHFYEELPARGRNDSWKPSGHRGEPFMTESCEELFRAVGERGASHCVRQTLFETPDASGRVARVEFGPITQKGIRGSAQGYPLSCSIPLGQLAAKQ